MKSKKTRWSALVATLTCLAGLPASATNFTLDQVSTVVTPSTQGAANTTWFGWELFDDPGPGNPIDDSTPDIGTTTTDLNFKTANGENHRSGGGNIYNGTTDHTLYEQVTVKTDGTVGTTGTTTIIAQFVTATGNFPNTVTLSSINGVLPVVVRGLNSAGKGQVWAKWQLPGNAASYTFTITGAPNVQHYSIDKVVVDTHWSTTTPQPDEMVAASPPTFKMDQQISVVAPTTRSQANTTWFGWDTFCESGFDAVPINDTTPDIGTTTTGVSFVTTNAQDHISSSRNLYVGSGTLSEEVTVVTDGTVGSGFTTIIAQAVTAFGGFPSNTITFSSINGVAPQVVLTTNIAGKGQVWAKWKLPGNQASYTFTVTGPTGVAGWSFDRFEVDTHWNASAYQTDTMEVGNPAQTITLDQSTVIVTPSSRGNLNTSYFGWDTFCEVGFDNVPINDTTPDIGTTTTGVSFVTTNAEDHISSSRNLYVGSGTLSEEVIVATSGTVGSTGTTTIIAQAITAFGGFPGTISFSSINGVAPTVVQTTNAAGKGQVWARWAIPGNQASYTFTVSGPTGMSGFSFDKFVVDTVWRLSGTQPDTVRVTTPAMANVMSTVSGLVAPTTRGNVKTTWFGWETLNNLGNRTSPAVINDSTPDLGHTTTAGANFQTTNGQTHVLSSGNLYFFSGTLAEQITVPTNGTVGSGFTTIILQIASASGFGAFADTITLGSLNDVAPEIVQSLNSTGTGQLWAKWKIPGNETTYTIPVNGPTGQAHFSFDKVTVDTLWSSSGYQGDSMAATAPSIVTNSPLPVGGVGAAYSQQLSGTGGNAPYTYALSTGTLPDGLTLSSSGLLDGTPTTAGASNFTLLLTDANGLNATKVFDLTVTTTPTITTDSPLPLAVVGVAYTQTFAATGGTTPYEWSVSTGTLPAGLTLNDTTGELSGTPTAAGTTNFTVQVEDDNGFNATKAFSVTFFDLTITTPATLGGGVVGKPYSVALAATGGTTPYAWSISSGTLPLGLELINGVITGTPTSAGGPAPFTVQLTDDDDFIITKQLSLTVFASPQVPTVNPISFGALPIGVQFDYTVSATNYPDSFSITGLPKGLSFKLVKEGVVNVAKITGKPAVTGVFNVQVSAKNKGGTSATVTAPLVVKALPTNMTGTFAGLVARHAQNTNLGSKLSLTIAANGFYTAKVTTGATLKSATGHVAASAPQIVVTVDNKPSSLTLANNELTGTCGGAVVTGYRQVWNAALNPSEDLAGYYSIALELATLGDVGVTSIPQGYGFATFTVTNAGTFTLAGKTADGQPITSPGFVGPAGELCVYAPQYANKGSLWGELTLSADAAGLFADNTASGTLDWFKAATTVPARTYLAPFAANPILLSAYGKYLAPKATGSVVLGLPSAGNTTDLKFEPDGVFALTTVTNPGVTNFGYSTDHVVTVPANPTKTTLVINKASGAVSGKFTLTETAPPLVRANVAFAGQTVRFATGNVKAVGHFLLPQIPVSPQTIKTSPILSGVVTVEE